MRHLLAAALLWQPPPPDGWWGADKLRHFFLSAFVQSVTYSAARAARIDHTPAIATATAATAIVGVGKELRDRRTGGSFSARDLAWDAAGAGVASGLLARTHR